MTFSECFEYVSHVRLVFLLSHCMSDAADCAAYELLGDIQQLFLEELKEPRAERLVHAAEDELKMKGCSVGTA